MLSIGGLLFLVTIMLFILRGIPLGHALSQRRIHLKLINLFRKIKGAKVYQRGIWLQGTAALPLLALLGQLGRLIVQGTFLAPLTTPLIVQNKAYFSALVGLTILP